MVNFTVQIFKIGYQVMQLELNCFGTRFTLFQLNICLFLLYILTKVIFGMLE